MDKQQIHEMLEDCRFPDTCRNTRLFETHISWVALTDHFAFKVKRPVKYSFLDFSTLEKREYYCNKELDLNKRLAPEMYLGVFPITAGLLNGNSKHSGDEIMDYTVQMKRMDNTREMDKLLKEKKVGVSGLEKLAVKIAGFHKNARIIKNVFNTTGFQEKYADILSVEDFITEKFGKKWSDKVRDCVDQSNFYLNTSRSYNNQRIITGFRRDCHGDLNASNIFLYDDPVIFDCIEFNEEYRYIDVLNDIAFLCVDLDFYGNDNLCDHFYQSYLKALDTEDDAESRSLFMYYKSYRANVRAKVTAISEMENGENETMIGDVKKYLELMYEYCCGF